MFWRTLGITCLALLLLTLREGVTSIFLVSPASPQTLETSSLRDAESFFAAGLQLPIGCARVTDLELISGISDTIARTLLRSREEDRSSSSMPAFRERLLSVKGVGPKLADSLLSFLSPISPCPESYGSARLGGRVADTHRTQR